MSKPISFGFGKAKVTPLVPAKKAKVNAVPFSTEPDDNDGAPKHETITGFSTSGVITTETAQAVTSSTERVIENAGNQDWRTRGQRQPQEQRNNNLVLVEKDEVSKASGLQFAEESLDMPSTQSLPLRAMSITQEVANPQSADEEALQALLNGQEKPSSTVVIASTENQTIRPLSETDAFKADVSTRPDSSTLADYAAMPIEEFGLAMLRGMGKKRKANGEVINLELAKEDDEKNKRKKQEGFLGVGAKPVPGLESAELGAWGKADMRKNDRGQGFFTPVMIRLATGETITEEELERRKKDAQRTNGGASKPERRDRNVEGQRHRNGDRDDNTRSEHNSHDNSLTKRRRSRSRDRDRRYIDQVSDHDRRRDRDTRHDRDRYKERDKDRPRSRSPPRRHRDDRTERRGDYRR